MSNQPLLHAEAYGEGKETFIFLHGLLGSSRNWRSIAKELQADFRIYCLDLRNHGSSFHHPDASIEGMSEDLLRFLDHHEISSAYICGHSLGGKVAMRFSCDHASRVEKLIIADIAPRIYPKEHHIPTLDALLGLELSSVRSRKDADDRLSGLIPNWAFRQFLLTNLVQTENRFMWKPNLGFLRNSIEGISSNPLQAGDEFRQPTLFIHGGKSGYLRMEHIPEIQCYFPSALFEVLPNAGHDVHVEDRLGFLTVLRDFLTPV